MTPVEIRVMTREDYDAVYALWQATEGMGLSEADSRESISAYLERNSGMSFVAMSGDRLVGAVICGHDGRRGAISHLAVDPAFRRQGVGARLAAACEAALARANIDRCHIHVFADNENALRFWKALGWFERPELVLMSKDIR